MMRQIRLVLVLIVGLGFVATTAFAKTPDGRTPAEETVCDNLAGAAFGLCNAYCEATDCGDGVNKANARACQSLRENWKKRTGLDRFPCDSHFGFTTGAFTFQGTIAGHSFEHVFEVASELTHENDGMGQYLLTSRIDFELIAFVGAENQQFIEQENVFSGMGTSRALAAIAVGAQVATSILEVIFEAGELDMNLVDAVMDAVRKQWTSSLGELLSPMESDQVFNALVAGICDGASACNSGDACTAAPECIGVPCLTDDGDAGIFKCPEGQPGRVLVLVCSPFIVE